MANKLLAPLNRPLMKAALTSGTIMSVGDVICQAIQRRPRGTDIKATSSCGSMLTENDWSRTGRFGLIGLTMHGPFFLYGFRWLDSVLAPYVGTTASLGSSVTKALVGNLTIFPVYVTGFYSYMGALEGLKPQDIATKVRQSFPPSFQTGFAFWAIANLFNFQYVPAHLRVYYVSAGGLVWNSYLSWANQRYGKVSGTERAALTGQKSK